MNKLNCISAFLFVSVLIFSCGIESDNSRKEMKVGIGPGVNVLMVDSLNYLIINNDSAQIMMEIERVAELGEILDKGIRMVDAAGQPLTTYGMIRLSGSETMFPAYVKWVNLETKKIPDVNLYAYDFERKSWGIENSLDRKATCFIEFSRNTWMDENNEVGAAGLCSGHLLEEVTDSLLNAYFEYCEICDCQGWIMLDFYDESGDERKLIEMKRSYTRFNENVSHGLDSILDKLCFRNYGPIINNGPIKFKLEPRVFFTFENSEERSKEVLKLTSEEIQGLERYGVNIERAMVYSIPTFGFYNLDKVTEGIVGDLQVFTNEGVSDVFWFSRGLKSILPGKRNQRGFRIENAVRSSNYEILTIDSLNLECVFQLYKITSSDSLVSLSSFSKTCLNGSEVKMLTWN